MSGPLRELIVRFVFQGDTKRIDAVNKGLNDIKDRAHRAGDGLDHMTNRAKANAGALGGLAGTIRGLVAGYLGFQAVSGVAHFIGQANAEFERLNAALVTATGSEAGARKAFDQIQKFAATTPYELGQVTDAFIKLKNLGLDPSEQALTSYGNTASAMGKPLMQMIEAVADASTLEFERLKEFGIKSKQQGDSVIFTFRGVKTTVKKDAKAIEKYLIGLGANQFAGGMKRQAMTLNGILSNLQDNFGRLARKVGSGGLLDALKRAASAMVETTSNGDSLAEKIGKTLGSAVDWLRENFGKLVTVAKTVGIVFAAWKIGSLVTGLYNLAKGATFASLAARVMGASFRTALISTGVGALIIAVGLLAEDIYQFATGGKSVIGGLVKQFPEFGRVVQGISDFFVYAGPIVSDFWYALMEGFQTAMAVYGPGLAMFGQWLWENLAWAFQAIAPLVAGFFTTAASLVIGFVEILTRVFNDPKAVVADLWRFIQAQFAAGIAYLLGAGASITGAIGNAFMGAYQAALGWIDGIVQAVLSLPSRVAGAMGSLAGQVAAYLGMNPGAAVGPKAAVMAGAGNSSTINYQGGPISVTTNNPAAAGAAINAGRAMPRLRPAGSY